MMKRTISLLLAALMLFALMPAIAFADEAQQSSAATETQESREDGKSVTIVNCKYAVNIRKGPSSKTKRIGSAKNGQVFKLLGTEANGKWYKIQYRENTAGYVFHDYVKVGSETPDPFPDGTTGTIVNCKTQVNVREKASSKSKLIGKAKKSETFKVLGRSGNWVRIEFESKEGFVYRSYIRVDGEETGKTVMIVNCKAQVNIRAKASSKSGIIGKAKKGATFELLGRSGSWYRIDFNGKVGYVFKRYVKIT